MRFIYGVDFTDESFFVIDFEGTLLEEISLDVSTDSGVGLAIDTTSSPPRFYASLITDGESILFEIDTHDIINLNDPFVEEKRKTSVFIDLFAKRTNVFIVLFMEFNFVHNSLD